MAQTLTNQDGSEQIIAFDLPDYTDIPDIGLFLEQTVKYINSYLAPLGDISLTGSMVSNYVKKKIITNPVKKQYSREQIAYLFFIAAAKTCLSLENLQKLIELQKTCCSCENAYEYFRDELKKALREVFKASDRSAFDGVITISDSDESPEKELLHKTAIAIAYQVYLTYSIAAIGQ
jgi:DNA-binding transcriptional MerR regulator